MCKFKEREEKTEEESQRHGWKDKSIEGQIAENASKEIFADNQIEEVKKNGNNKQKQNK